MAKAVIIGAGIAGLASAAVLARAGLDVTVLEAHVYPGGCAGTFYHQGYRFDAGATLAGGFYENGPMDMLARAIGLMEGWPARPADIAMRVHLPDGTRVDRRGDENRWDAYKDAFGEKSLSFWRWQETTADALWNFALRLPSWPPQNAPDLYRLTSKGLDWLAHLNLLKSPPKLINFAADSLRTVQHHLGAAPENLRLLIDAQLLISAQSTGAHTNALYGAAALDLPRRGVVHIEGGMGKIADILVQSVRANGGRVLFRHEVSNIRFDGKKASAVETRRGEVFDADIIIANLTPWNIAKLLGPKLPPRLSRLAPFPPDQWGAFVIYAGVDGSIASPTDPLHHQVIIRRPLGEGNTLFLSLSPEWDQSRSPSGKRALTISTHTDLKTWWDLFHHDQDAYKKRRDRYAEMLLSASESVLPGLREAAGLVLPGTPITFERFTGRSLGWVGGFQQTSLLKSWGPRLASNLWMVGDSIFPGQSVAAAALGGLRVAGDILHRERQSLPTRALQWEVSP